MGSSSKESELLTNSEDLETLLLHGLQCGQDGDPATAVSFFSRAVALAPDSAQALHNLAIAYAELNETTLAVHCLEKAIGLNTQYAEAFYNLGTLLLKLGRRTEAISAFYEAIRLRADYVEPMINLSLTLLEVGRSHESLMIIRQAVRLKPESLEARNNWGLILHDLGRFTEAIEVWETLLDTAPANVDVHTNCGSTLKEMGRFREAIGAFDWAIRLDPSNVSARWNRALTLLQGEQFAEGWKEYEWRWKRDGMKPRQGVAEPWNGEALAGKTIFVYVEQGIGDMIMFLRYCEQLKMLGAFVVLECPRRLCFLFSSCPWVNLTVPEHEATDLQVDFEVSLLSLPYRCWESFPRIPCNVPYLFADREKRRLWHEKLKGEQKLLIGICWQGNPLHRFDHHRSLPLEALGPLAKLPGVRLISLKKIATQKHTV